MSALCLRLAGRASLRLVRGSTAPHNKELKLTKPCTIGASQLNSSVRRLIRR